jgi:alanine-glyoxylate transaminase/serine-glyoxylate transaminase/serine-pyruvate transaminase
VGNGYFGERMASMARRAGGNPVVIAAPWGRPLDPDDVRAALAKHRPAVFGFVHAETSTGALQPDVPALTAMAHEAGALVIVDTVTSLGGVELRVDEWNVDVAYSGAQKCLSCPPGASPLTLSDGAFDRIRKRKEPARSWYLDVGLLESYWGEERSYHHTAPITHLGADFWRLRLGIGHPGDRSQVIDYVLRRAPTDEEEQLLEAVGDALATLPVFLEQGAERAMNGLHGKG